MDADVTPTRLIRLALEECFSEEVEAFVKGVDDWHADLFGPPGRAIDATDAPPTPNG
jgi:hypothetical protein